MEHINFDWSIKLGDLLTIAGFISFGITFALRIGRDVGSLKETETNNATRIEELKHAVASLSETTVTLARQDERMKGFERALTNFIKDVRDEVRVLQHPGG